MIEIKRPTLIIHEQKVRKNLETMSLKAQNDNLIFRPHFKTHQSADVANWYRDYGVEKIAVSSVSMASYFAKNGWKDITIAFPYNPYEYDDIEDLARKVKLTILLESVEAFDHANRHIKADLSYYIKIDVGTRRTGLDQSRVDLISELVEKGHEKLRYRGLLAHAGHSYGARSEEEIQGTYSDSLEILNKIQEEIGNQFISFGDTPTASVLESFPGIDELRCGNFVYYDLTQNEIGSCTRDQIAVAMAVPVVSLHPERNEVVIYGGAVHFSKDMLEIAGGKYFGQVVRFQENGWEIVPKAYLKSISQEHGIITGTEEFISNIKFGDVLGVLPVHSCLASDLTKDQMTLTGKKIQKLI